MKIKLLSGNEAIVEGALVAGLDFFSAYPITPASEVMEAVIKISKTAGQLGSKSKKIKYLQAEDEIAAINMCLGASLVGDKAMTATSGPGFSLMQETIGLAFKIGVPLVIVNCQRVGPSTGMPTLGSQGDVLQAVYGSHGDQIRLVFCPNSVEEAYRLTIEAFNAAEESLSPVILLVDGTLAHLHETISIKKIQHPLKKRKILPLGKAKRHFTGLSSFGNLPATQNSVNYRKWFQKRKGQVLKAAQKYSFYEYSKPKKHKTLLVVYGIVSRVLLELKGEYDLFRPIRLFPVVEDLKKIAQNYSQIVVIEMNDGQYHHELEAFLKREIGLISQLGGEISLKEIKNELKKIN